MPFYSPQNTGQVLSFENHDYFQTGISSKMANMNSKKIMINSQNSISLNKEGVSMSAHERNSISQITIGQKSSPYMLPGPIRPVKIIDHNNQGPPISLQGQIKNILQKRSSRDLNKSTHSLVSSSRIVKERLPINPEINESSEVPESMTDNMTATLTALEDLKNRKQVICSKDLFSVGGQVYGMQAMECLSQEIDVLQSEQNALEQKIYLMKSAKYKSTTNSENYLRSIPKAWEGLQNRNSQLEDALTDTDNKIRQILSRQTDILKQNQMLQSKNQRLKEKAFLSKYLSSCLADMKANDRYDSSSTQTSSKAIDDLTSKALMRAAYYCLPNDDELVARVDQLHIRMSNIQPY